MYCEKRLFQIEQREREGILKALKSLLEARTGIVFAYVHGSFVQERPFHDIDVAVYLVVEKEAMWEACDLSLELEQGLSQVDALKIPRIPIDIQILNRASWGFCYHVLKGECLFSRDEKTRAQWIQRVLAHYLDLKPLQQRALKEAMTA